MFSCLELLLPLTRAAYGLIMRPNDFASYLLAIGICNLLLYFAFYIIMKVNGEDPKLGSVSHSVLGRELGVNRLGSRETE